MLVTVLFFALSLGTAFSNVDPFQDELSLGCNLFAYEHRIEQADSAGRKCWGNVAVMSCKGRCETREISYWKFPHKKAFHTVCLHAEKMSRFTILKNCDPDVEPGTEIHEIVEAKSCKCQVCSPEKANCVGQAKPNHPNLALVMAGKRFENLILSGN